MNSGTLSTSRGSTRSGTPPAGAHASMAVHESQSRLLENQIGRGRAFCDWLHLALAERFDMTGVESADDLYRAVNAVETGWIRTEADEVHYNLHVMMRFDLERALIAGDLAVADLRSGVETRVRPGFRIAPPNARRGVLQDVHWSAGLFGYFPTYALGNVYAAELHAAMRSALPDLETDLRRGDLAAALAWLGGNVHRKGRLLAPRRLIAEACGHEPDEAALLAYLTRSTRSTISERGRGAQVRMDFCGVEMEHPRRVGRQPHGLVDLEVLLSEPPHGEQPVILGVDVDVGLAAEMLDVADRAGDVADVAADRQVLGAHAEGLSGHAERAGLQEVHPRRADEAGDEDIVGIVVEPHRRADLLDAAGVQDDDAVGERHRLNLVVGDVDHLVAARSRCSRAISMRVATRSAASRLDSGSSKRNSFGVRTIARPMATRWRWPPESSAGRRSSSGSSDSIRLASATRSAISARAGLLQPQAHVVADRKVRVERVGLEDHGDLTLRRRRRVDAGPVEQHVAGGGVLKPGDDPQQRRLAAAGRADEDTELAVLDIEIDALDHFGLAEGLGDAAERERAHQSRTGAPLRTLSSAARQTWSEATASCTCRERSASSAIARATKAAWRSQSAWWPGSSAMLRSTSGAPTRCRRMVAVRVWVSMSSTRVLGHADRHRAARGHHVLHEEGRVRHHRAPSRLVPAERAVLEQHLEMPVVVHGLRDLGREPQPHAAHLHGPRIGDLEHHVDIVHAAVHDGRGGRHQRLVHLPGRPGALLIEVEAEDVWPAQRSGFRDETLPGRVVAKDVADDDLAAGLDGLGGDASGVGQRGGERLLHEDMGARVHRRERSRRGCRNRWRWRPGRASAVPAPLRSPGRAGSRAARRAGRASSG